MKNRKSIVSILAGICSLCVIGGVTVATTAVQADAETVTLFTTTAPTTYSFDNRGDFYLPLEQGENNVWLLGGNVLGSMVVMTEDTASGDGNIWKGLATYNGVWWRENMGPDNQDDAIVAWRAPQNGTVKFQGKFFRTSAEYGNSDGVTVKAYNRKTVDGEVTQLFSQSYYGNVDFTLYLTDTEISVVSGETYFFAVDQNGAGGGNSGTDDTVHCWFKPVFTADETNPGEAASGSILATPPLDSSVLTTTVNYAWGAQSEYYTAPTYQGENNVWVLYGDAQTGMYEMTTTQTDGNHWSGGVDNNNSWWRQQFGASGGYDAIVGWRAPYNGTVKFTGKMFKENVFGNAAQDGVTIKAYNRKSFTSPVTELYNKTFFQDFVLHFNGIELEVVSGEAYFFAVDQYINDDWGDQTNIWFKAEFTKDETNPGTVAENRILATDAEIFEAQTFDMIGGAQVRMDANTGLRFSALYAKSDVEYWTAKGYTVEMGMLIAPTQFITGEKGALTLTNTNYTVGTDYKQIVCPECSIFDGNYRINGVLKVREANYNAEFTGIGYIKLTKNGETLYKYAKEDSEKGNSRSIAYMAKEVLANQAGLTDPQKEILNAIIEKAQA